MVVTKPTEQDGRMYYAGEDMPDLGSLVGTTRSPMTGRDTDPVCRSYVGLYSDFDKLPKHTDLHYENLATGSTAKMISNEGVRHYIYERTTNTWYFNYISTGPTQIPLPIPLPVNCDRP